MLTVYPDREIQFLNKGINGGTADRAITGFAKDITNDDFSDMPDYLSIMRCYDKYKEYKSVQAEMWNEINTLDSEANALAKTDEIKVVISKQ